MTDPIVKYEQALASFAIPGNRWREIPSLTLRATTAGLRTEEVLADAHGVGVLDRDGDIRRGMDSAAVKIAANSVRTYALAQTSTFPPLPRERQDKQPLAFPDRVLELIKAGQDVCSLASLRTLSPAKICPDHDPLALRVQCEMQLLSYFKRTDIIHVFRPDRPTVGEPGKNLRTLGKWLTDPSGAHPDHAGEIVRPNPFTGNQGTTRNGKASFIAQSCLAAYRHMVVEFDSLPLEDQCRFWAGFVRLSPLPLVSLVYSGNKSIHGIIRVDAVNLDAWARYRGEIIRLFASNHEKRYQLDPQALHPLTGTRLAGIRRRTTGKLQELLWVKSSWHDPTWQQELNGVS